MPRLPGDETIGRHPPHRVTLDLPLDDDRPPERGDLIVSARLVYVVLDARPVDSRVWENRWHVDLRRHGPSSGPWPSVELGARCFRTQRYEKGETPREFFARHLAGTTDA